MLTDSCVSSNKQELVKESIKREFRAKGLEAKTQIPRQQTRGKGDDRENGEQ